MRATLDRRYDRRVDEHGAGRTTRIICAPIKSGAGKVLGVISACDVDKGLKNLETKSFAPEENLFLQALASQLAISVESTADRTATALRARIGTVHAQIGDVLACTHTVEELCDAVAEIIRDDLGAEACTILLSEGKGRERRLLRAGVAMPFEQGEDGPPGCAAELGDGKNEYVAITEGLMMRLLDRNGQRLVDVAEVATASRDSFHPNHDQKFEPPARNVVALPLIEPASQVPHHRESPRRPGADTPRASRGSSPRARRHEPADAAAPPRFAPRAPHMR